MFGLWLWRNVFKSEKIGWHWQWFIAYDCSGGFYCYVITCNHCVSFTADVNFTSIVTSLITCPRCVRFVYGRLGDLQITANLCHWCKSISLLPVAERTIFGFACERTRGSWIHACNTTMQYEFVSHCVLHRRLAIKQDDAFNYTQWQICSLRN